MQRRLTGLIFLSAILPSLFATCTAGSPFYLLEQGAGQAGILWNRRPIDEALADPTLTVDRREKLAFMREVRQFAKDHLHLRDTDSFQSYVEVPGDAVSYLVMAAPELELSPKKWWFPVVGDVPYLGFFDPDDADAFEEYLKKEGLDTHQGQAAAYSTLGWFSDPVFSSQLKYSKAYLAGLVIHEMLHSTVWVKGRPEFNEAFASFVEEKGRDAYFLHAEGAQSPTLKRLALYKEEERRLNALLDRTEQELKRIYDSSASTDEKRAQKSKALLSLKEELRRSAPQFRIIKTDDLAEEDWNNASFTSRGVYRSDWPAFEREYETCQRDIVCLVESYRLRAERADENEAFWKP